MKTACSGTSTRPATPGQSGNNAPLHNQDSNINGAESNADQDDRNTWFQGMVGLAIMSWILTDLSKIVTHLNKPYSVYACSHCSIASDLRNVR